MPALENASGEESFTRVTLYSCSNIHTQYLVIDSKKINHFECVYFCIGSLSKSMQFIHMTVYINIYVLFVSHQQCVFMTE